MTRINSEDDHRWCSIVSAGAEVSSSTRQALKIAVTRNGNNPHIITDGRWVFHIVGGGRGKVCLAIVRGDSGHGGGGSMERRDAITKLTRRMVFTL